jgi:hypothetical protein
MRINFGPTLIALSALTLAVPSLTGCGEKTRSGEIPTLDLEAAIDNPRTFDLAGIAERIEFIHLDDTQKEALVGDINRIAESKGRFHVTDDIRQSPVKIFDRQGKFIRAEGRFGRGPGEYTDIISIVADHDTDNLVMAVMAGMQGAMVTCDPGGREVARADSVMVNKMAIHDGNLLLLRSRMLRLEGEDNSVGKLPFMERYSADLQREWGVETGDTRISAILRFSALGPDGANGVFVDGIRVSPMYVRDNRLVGVIQARDIVDAADRLTRPDLKELASSFKEESNPVIVVVELK